MSSFSSFLKLLSSQYEPAEHRLASYQLNEQLLQIELKENPQRYVFDLIASLIKHFDGNGYIRITKEIDEIILNIFNILYTHVYKIKPETPFPVLTDVHSIGEQVFLSDLFEKFAFHSLVSVPSSYDNARFTVDIYMMYFFLITIQDFQSYIEFNPKLNYNNEARLKEISNYISDQKYDLIEFYSSFTGDSFRLLSLGHLSKMDFKERKDVIIEPPHYALARCALELHKGVNDDADFNVIKTYKHFIRKLYVPSTPMFFHSLTSKNLLSSCFVLNVEDNTTSLANLFSKMIHIQKYNSGIGINLNKLRCANRPVMNGVTAAKGVNPYLLHILGTLSEFYRNSKRERGSNINVTISIDNPDVLGIINLKTGQLRKEDMNFNNIFPTISIPDEFMYRLIKDEPWYLISPEQTCDGFHLYDVVGDDYSILYNRMIQSPTIEKIKTSPLELLSKIINAMIQSGSPCLFFKDTVNLTSNQRHHGVIQATNLCTEILQYHDDEETACCNLTSIILKNFVNPKTLKFDFTLFEEAVENIVYLLNNSIDQSFYSHKTCEKSNKSKRPLGIGIQGLANMLAMMQIPFIEGKHLYTKISENLYYNALKASNRFAKEKRFPLYDEEKKSPLSNGVFCFELFHEHQMNKRSRLEEINTEQSNRLAWVINPWNYYSTLNWEPLREDIKKYGVVNSLLIALMPTSFTSGVFNNVESFEPFTYNILKRDYTNFSSITYNQELVDFLLNTKEYNSPDVINELIRVEGNVSKLTKLSDEEKGEAVRLFKTIYDYPTTTYIDFISTNNHLVDQGKSTNIYSKSNDNNDIFKSILLHWVLGTKTTYYYRSEIKINPTTLNDFKKGECDVCN